MFLCPIRWELLYRRRIFHDYSAGYVRTMQLTILQKNRRIFHDYPAGYVPRSWQSCNVMVMVRCAFIPHEFAFSFPAFTQYCLSLMSCGSEEIEKQWIHIGDNEWMNTCLGIVFESVDVAEGSGNGKIICLTPIQHRRKLRVRLMISIKTSHFRFLAEVAICGATLPCWSRVITYIGIITSKETT